MESDSPDHGSVPVHYRAGRKGRFDSGSVAEVMVETGVGFESR